MIALQAAEPSGVTQLVDLLQALVVVAIFLAIAIVAISLLTLPRPAGGFEPTGGVVGQPPEEETEPRSASALVKKYEIEVLRYLSRAEAADLQDLLSQLPDSREYISEALSRLAESGLVEVSSGIAVLTEKGRKTLELLREKRWLKDIEKTEE